MSNLLVDQILNSLQVVAQAMRGYTMQGKLCVYAFESEDRKHNRPVRVEDGRARAPPECRCSTELPPMRICRPAEVVTPHAQQ